jgi:hypothetical protein
MLYVSFAYTDGTFLWVNAGTTTFGLTYPGAVYGMVQSSFHEQMRLAKAECKLAGYTLNGVENGFSVDTCSQCPAGKYSLGTGLFTAKCLPCPANSHSLAGASQCTANVGYYMGMARRAVEPSAGSFLVFNDNNLSTAVPFDDHDHHHSVPTAVYFPTQVFSACARTIINCSSASFLHCSSFGPTVCCGKQTYFLEGILSTDCLPCPLGAVSSGAGSSCRSCAVGQYIAGSTCTDCAPGSYSATNHQSACALCAEGTYQPANASTACAGCQNPNAWSAPGATACACKPGYDGMENCTACAAGSFKAELGNGRCGACPPNTFCPQAFPSTSPVPCPARMVSPPASANRSDCVCDQGLAGAECEVSVAAVVAGAAVGVVAVAAAVGVGVWWWKGGGGRGSAGGGGRGTQSQCASDLLQNLNIDLRVDTRGGYVPVEKIQKD